MSATTDTHIALLRTGLDLVAAGRPKLTFDIQHELAAGDLVAFNITYTARHTGDFLGIPATGRTVSWQSLEHYRVEDGLIAEEWIASDIASLMGQLTAEPVEPAAPSHGDPR